MSTPVDSSPLQLNIIDDNEQCMDESVNHDHFVNPEYTTYHSMPRVADKSIRQDLVRLGVSDQIANKAIEIHSNLMIQTKRAKRRKMMVFYCVLEAYNYFNIVIDPKVLAGRCDVEASHINRATSMCAPKSGNGTIVIRTPLDFIEPGFNTLKKEMDYQIEFNEETLIDIQDMARDIIDSDPGMLDEKPQRVAAAIIYYYLELNGINVDLKIFSSWLETSPMNINKIKKDIDIAYNS